MSAGTGFEFATATRIVFGAGRAGELPAMVSGLGGRVFACTGTQPDRYADLLAGLPIVGLFPVGGEPTVETARAALAQARGHGVDIVVAIGGGSVLDLGKVVAGLLTGDSDPLDHLEIVGRGLPITRPGAPFVAVPTTAGTGSEVTANAVLAVPGYGLKASLRSPYLLPRIAMVDPRLTLGCPPSVTAASGLDALTQCLEPFVSVRANPLTDGFAREGLRRAASGLLRAYTDGSDLAARTDMALCGLLGGLALANAKLGAVHGLAGVIGGLADIPHGAVCAALLAPVVAANLRALGARDPHAQALRRYEEVARLLTGRPEAGAADAVGWLRENVAALGIPGLRALGLPAATADEVAVNAAKSSSMQGNPVLLGHDELLAVLAEAA